MNKCRYKEVLKACYVCMYFVVYIITFITFLYALSSGNHEWNNWMHSKMKQKFPRSKIDTYI